MNDPVSSLTTVRLSGGARLPVSVKSLLQLHKRVEAAARQAKADATTLHPRTVIAQYKAALADTQAVAAAMRATERDLLDAVDLLDNKANPLPSGKFSLAAAELKTIAAALTSGSSTLARAKASAAMEDARGQLLIALFRVRHESESAAKVQSTAQMHFQRAFTESLRLYNGPLAVTCSEVKALMGWSFLPDDNRVLPAPSFSEYEPASSLKRLAGTIVTLARSKDAAAKLIGDRALQKAAAKTPDAFMLALKAEFAQ